MSTATVSAPSTVWLRPKYILAACIAFVFLYVLVHNESFLINKQDREWPHIQPYRWYLLPHALAGACALLLAPMQFSDHLRKRFAKLHRVIGRFYVGGVLIAAPMGFYVQFFRERLGDHRSFSVAAAAQATAWMVTTLIALAFILQGKVDAHRRWMTRSFSVALVFLEVRFILGVTGWGTLDASVIETVVWSCNIFALLAADIVLHWNEMFQRRPVQRAAVAAGD